MKNLHSSGRRNAIFGLMAGIGASPIFQHGSASAQSADGVGAPSIRDVKAYYGAIGDGEADDTDAIQRAVDDVGRGTGGVILLPPGTYRVTREIKFPEASGGGLFLGSGCYVGDPRSKRRKSSHSTIIWDGEAGATVMSARGNLGWKIAHLTFVGRRKADGAQAACAYHCQFMPTAGSGVGIFELCHFVDFDFAIKMGEGPKDYGCADYVFTMCSFEHCEVCVWVVNNQGLNYNFFYVSANWCGTFFRAEKSGHVYIYNGQFAGCGRPDAWVLDFKQLDDNASVVVVNGMRVEQKTTHVMKAVGKGAISMVGYEECQGAQDAPMFWIDGPSLAITGSRLLKQVGSKRHFTVRATKNRQGASLNFERVYFDSQNFQLDDWIDCRDGAAIQVRSCTSGPDQSPIVNFNTNPAWGEVMLLGKSQPQKDTWLSFPYQSTEANATVPWTSPGLVCLALSGVVEETGEIIDFPEVAIRLDAIKKSIVPPAVTLPGGVTLNFRTSENNRAFSVAVGSATKTVQWQAICKLRLQV